METKSHWVYFLLQGNAERYWKIWNGCGKVQKKHYIKFQQTNSQVIPGYFCFQLFFDILWISDQYRKKGGKRLDLKYNFERKKLMYIRSPKGFLLCNAAAIASLKTDKSKITNTIFADCLDWTRE